jgi:NADH-quinone oxidoreductase subunit D
MSLPHLRESLVPLVPEDHAQVRPELRTDSYTVNFGPHHPSTHGVLHIIVKLDVETVVDSDIVFGYLHRGVEKLAESRSYLQDISLTDRLDYVSAFANNHAYVCAVERLAGIQVPERAEYIRVICAEMSRLASHLLGTGVFGQDLGIFVTTVFYGFNWREELLDLFEGLAGARMMVNYMRFGGVAYDLPEDFAPRLLAFLDKLPGRIEQFHRMLTRNEIFQARTQGIGVLSPEAALNYSVTGPSLRGSGVAYDIRKHRPYSVYDRFAFKVATWESGDCFGRYMVRILEMEESAKIIRQAIAQMPNGPIQGKAPKVLRPPKGDAYHEIEAPKGALGFYLMSDGSVNPYRWKVRSPSFINLGALPALVKGWKLADMVAIFGSLDINMGEVDR